MTTATEPPLVDEPSIGVDELPALDDNRDWTCQMQCERGRDVCGRPAAWHVSGTCGHCGTPDEALLCHRCRNELVPARGHPHARCTPCGQWVCVTQVSPL